jgi:hypothetical protein
MYTVVFVCQNGFIEIQSLFLACSLRRYLRGDFQIVAAHPKNFGSLDKVTLDTFDRLDIEVISFKNNFHPIFHMANKPYSLSLIDGPVLYVDSDIILTKPFHPNVFPECDVFCFTEDPFFSYSSQEWDNISALFGVEIPPCPEGEINLQCTNAPIAYCSSGGIGEKWLDFSRRLHSEVHSDRIEMKRKRKITNICFGMAVRAMGLDLHVSEPITWDGSPDWWSQPRCQCHEWEKKTPVSKRMFNKFLSVPDLVYYYEGDEQKCLGTPYFYCLQNGFGYCPEHQGGDFPVKIGLDHYPNIRSILYSFLRDNPLLDQHPEWNQYIYRYFQNEDSEWFQKPKNYGTKRKTMLL